MTSIDPPESADDWPAVRAWRKRMRETLIGRRSQSSAQERRQMAAEVCARLLKELELADFRVLAFCWPIRGEFDLRSIAERHLAQGGEVALPVVVTSASPLEFWRWHPGMPMTTGVWNIPIPKTPDRVQPDLVFAPLVGFDRRGFRLGYGGGYFDRTLASASPRPTAVGVGYSNSELESIFPQPHDIPLSLIVTEKEAFRPAPAA